MVGAFEGAALLRYPGKFPPPPPATGTVSTVVVEVMFAKSI